MTKVNKLEVNLPDLLEQIASAGERWVEEPYCIRSGYFDCRFELTCIFDERLDMAIRLVRKTMPEMARLIQGEYREILQEAKQTKLRDLNEQDHEGRYTCSLITMLSRFSCQLRELANRFKTEVKGANND